MLFAEKEPGCNVKSNIIGGTEDTQNYLRLKVRNDGRTTAHNVSVCLTTLRFVSGGSGRREFGEEVLDLTAALVLDRKTVSLAPGAHRYFDLVYTTIWENPDPGWLCKKNGVTYGLGSVVKPARLDRLGYDAGNYEAEIFVTGDGAASKHGIAKWSWDGTFLGLRITDWTPR